MIDVFCPHMPSYIRRLLPRCYLRVVYHQVVEPELIVASYTYQSTTGQYRPAQPAQDRGTLDTRDFPWLARTEVQSSFPCQGTGKENLWCPE